MDNTDRNETIYIDSHVCSCGVEVNGNETDIHHLHQHQHEHHMKKDNDDESSESGSNEIYATPYSSPRSCSITAQHLQINPTSPSTSPALSPDSTVAVSKEYSWETLGNTKSMNRTFLIGSDKRNSILQRFDPLLAVSSSDPIQTGLKVTVTVGNHAEVVHDENFDPFASNAETYVKVKVNHAEIKEVDENFDAGDPGKTFVTETFENLVEIKNDVELDQNFIPLAFDPSCDKIGTVDSTVENYTVYNEMELVDKDDSDSVIISRAKSLSQMSEGETELVNDKETTANIQELLRQQKESIKDLEGKLAIASKNDGLDRVLAEYEKSMAGVIRELDEWKLKVMDLEKEKGDLVKERDQAATDLHNVESAFSDVFGKYERAKVVMKNMKDNQCMFEARDLEMQDRLVHTEGHITEVEEEAKTKIKRLFADFESRLKAQDLEITRLKVVNRKLEMKNDTLEHDVKQKLSEIQKLNALCDELINQK